MKGSPLIKGPASPLDLLLPYQRKWAFDEARFKFGLMARQTGKDFASACEVNRHIKAVELKGGKTDWLIAAPSERQSLEHLGKEREWAETFGIAVADYTEEREGKSGETLLKSATLTFPGGSRIIAVPGRPDTVRGFSANVLLTEFAFFEDPDRTWRAILPSITNPLRGGPKKCRLITTPNGMGNKAHELWERHGVPPSGGNAPSLRSDLDLSMAALPPEGGTPCQGARVERVGLADGAMGTARPTIWSCHRVDIQEAVAAGLEVDIEELRSALNDPEGWAQEYELQFLDQATVLLPYELIGACENPLASETVPDDFWNAAGGEPLFGGWDFARKHDLSVIWTLGVAGGCFKMTREVLAMKGLPTPPQIEIARQRIRRMRRLCLDYTGVGVGLGDWLVKEFGEYNPERHQFGKIELCQFTNGLKVDIFPKLRMAFEQRTLGIPVSRAIREDLHSMSRVALAGGGVTYRAPYTADGHADRCTALALALRAASSNAAPFAVATVRILGRGFGGRRGILL